MRLPNRKDYYKAPREKLKLSRALHGARSYNFYWLKPSTVIQNRTCTLHDKAVPLFQNESAKTFI